MKFRIKPNGRAVMTDIKEEEIKTIMNALKEHSEDFGQEIWEKVMAGYMYEQIRCEMISRG